MGSGRIKSAHGPFEIWVLNFALPLGAYQADGTAGVAGAGDPGQGGQDGGGGGGAGRGGVGGELLADRLQAGSAPRPAEGPALPATGAVTPARTSSVRGAAA